MAGTREYKGIVCLDEKTELDDFFSTLTANDTLPQVAMQLTGMDITETFTGEAKKHHLRGGYLPALDPALVRLVWTNTNNSQLQCYSRGESDSSSIISVTFHGGTIDIDPFILGGSDHDIFNDIFGEGASIPIRSLGLKPDYNQPPDQSGFQPLVGHLKMTRVLTP